MIPASMRTPWPAVAAAVLLIGAGFAGGYALKGRLDATEIERLRGDLARMAAAHAEDKRAAAEAAAARLAQAEAAAREATLALQATKSALAATQKRLKEELHALPTAGRCGLSGPPTSCRASATPSAGGNACAAWSRTTPPGARRWPTPAR